MGMQPRISATAELRDEALRFTRRLRLPEYGAAMILLATVDVNDGEIPFHPGGAEMRWIVEQARENFGVVGWPLPRADGDIELDRTEQGVALAISRLLLGSDLAYNAALATSQAIDETVRDLIAWVGAPHFFFTNMNVVEDHIGGSWSPISEATFDGCVLITSRDRVAAILQFAED